MTLPSEPDGAGEDWRDLERLAARIYRELDPKTRVVHNAVAPGTLSEVDRQVDVLVEDPDSGTRVVVDCKDWKKRVDVRDVGAFASLVEDVQGTCGVLICNRGFSKGARTLARVKGISLCMLHDVESRKWHLDVLVPVIWTQSELLQISPSFRASFAAGDSLPTVGLPEFRLNGVRVNPLDSFIAMWNKGLLAPRPGDPGGTWTGRLPVELVTLQGHVRYALFSVEARFVQRSRLGYLEPRDSRGIVDVETGAYTTVRLDASATLLQQPESGWQEIGAPEELAIAPRATVLTLAEIQDVRITETRIVRARYEGP